MSERTIDPLTRDEIAKGQMHAIILAKIAFPSGTIRIWTGQGQISWDSQTWDGSGEVVGFSIFPEVTDGSSQGVQITLSGIDSDIIRDATEDEFQGSVTDIWLGFVDSSGAVIDDPVKLFGGYLDTTELNDNGQSATIVFKAESRLIRQLQPIRWSYTHEDQKKLYPGTTDKGLEFIPLLQEKPIVWD